MQTNWLEDMVIAEVNVGEIGRMRRLARLIAGLWDKPDLIEDLLIMYGMDDRKKTHELAQKFHHELIKSMGWVR